MTRDDHPRFPTPARRGSPPRARPAGRPRAIAAATLLAALACPARADEAAPPPAAGAALIVAVPDGTGPVAGFDRDLFAEAGREAGLSAGFVVAAPGAALAELDAGRIDVAAGPYTAGAAEKRHALPPVLTEGDALLKRRGDGSLLAPADAAGKRLGPIGPPGDAARLRAAAAALQARGAARLGGFAFDPQGDLAAGRLAALVGSLPDVAAAALRRPDGFEVVGPVFGHTARLAPLMRADRPDLAARLGAALFHMRADGRLAALQRRWFGLVFDPPDAPAPQPSPVSTSKP